MGNHKSIANFKIRFGDLQNGAANIEMKRQKGAGQCFIGNAEIKKKESFLDYIFGGC